MAEASGPLVASRGRGGRRSGCGEGPPPGGGGARESGRIGAVGGSMTARVSVTMYDARDILLSAKCEVMDRDVVESTIRK